jgi:mono/diheme cytochrome c family protein
MRGFLAGIAVTLIIVFGGGYLIANRGWVPIGADNPPGSMERRLTHMAVDTYVDAHAPKQENPVAPTAANLSEGARIYEARCAVCHGGGALRISPLRSKFSPPVPQIINRVPHDPDGNLWWLTKHGVRLTGMPAWDGILSDDEMWKTISFLKHSNKLPPEALAAWRTAAGGTLQPAEAGPKPGTPGASPETLPKK